MRGPATNPNEFLEKFQTTFDPPPPHFLENYIKNFFIMDMVSIMQGDKEKDR